MPGPVLHSASAAHDRHTFFVVSQMGLVPLQCVSPTHSTHFWASTSQTGLPKKDAPVHSVPVPTHSTHRWAFVSQAGFAGVALQCVDSTHSTWIHLGAAPLLSQMKLVPPSTAQSPSTVQAGGFS